MNPALLVNKARSHHSLCLHGSSPHLHIACLASQDNLWMHEHKNVNDQHGEMFHEDIVNKEKCDKAKWSLAELEDFC